ncbi:MAG: FHA domain-containing protein [Clostridia bacterium]|nr:FHA domain-containing protein [Clostridia bacterium]
MEMKQCAYGHFYDSSVYNECPYCGDKSLNSANPNVVDREEIGATLPLNGATKSFPQDEGVTIPLDDNQEIRPVVGWLVCVEGPNRGRSYEIHNENNFIGRSETMDINIQGDQGISRDKPVIVTYDSHTRSFFCGFMNGRGVVRLNGTPLLSTTVLKQGDVIEISKTRLMFIPLSSESFDWDWENLE